MSGGLRHLLANKEYKGAWSLFSPSNAVESLMEQTGVLPRQKHSNISEALTNAIETGTEQAFNR